jgi:beta-lactamase regulating signal transducer with metallopeptidase domain
MTAAVVYGSAGESAGASAASGDAMNGAAEPAGATGAAGAGAESAPVLAQPVAAAVDSSWQAATRAWLDPAIPWVVAFWLVGVALLTLRLGGGCVAARRIAIRGSEPAAPEWVATLARLRRTLRVSRPVELVSSVAAQVPFVVGWLRPVVVVPVSVFAGLTPWQIEVVLAHELAHVRRHDYLVNLCQSAVETLLFYHPAIWWVSRQVREERERCCDDVAVGHCGDAVGYVRTLAELAALRAPALAMSATGGSLLGRARRLLTPAGTRRSSGAAAAAAALIFVAFAWASAHAEVSGGGAPFGDTEPVAPVVPIARTAAVVAAPRAVAGPPAPLHRAQPDRPALPARSVPARAPSREVRAQHDAPDLIDSMNELGYRRIPVEKLIALGTHGVTREFVRGMNSLGLGRLPVDTLVALKIHGVTPGYVRELRAAGVTITRADQLQSMKIHGVTAAAVRDARRLGYTPSPEQLVQLRIHRLIPRRRSR